MAEKIKIYNIVTALDTRDNPVSLVERIFLFIKTSIKTGFESPNEKQR